MTKESVAELAKALPPVGVGGLTLWGVQLSDWVLILSAIYTLFLLIDKFPTMVQRCRAFARWLKKE